MMCSEKKQSTAFSTNRRNFLKVCMIGGVVAAMPGMSSPVIGQEQKKPGVLKLSSQEGRIPGKTLKEKVTSLESWGGCGMEFGGNAVGRVKEIQDALKGTKIKVSAICWGSHSGDLVSMDMEKRKKGIQDIKDALSAAGELESTGVIFVPCFHKQSTLQNDEIRKILIDILPDIGNHAQKCKTRVLLEPLNSGETFYLKKLEQAASICNELKNSGIAMMGDFYHMKKEETSDKEAFITAGNNLHHVHLASTTRVLPGQDDRSFVDGFRGLKIIGYQDYCSLECGCKKKTDPAVEIPKAFEFLKKQWEEATV
ncbi:MAG: sugar phosphate isomerase/epimerase [Kiritimatiellae bacterium]|nr:sugar phosphate isomerase/epimerase [Kiritimatiellia bacterium]MDD5520620.1 sugar phosphate isomerase/epimerase [Kiritimatiellia bacterium]